MLLKYAFGGLWLRPSWFSYIHTRHQPFKSIVEALCAVLTGKAFQGKAIEFIEAEMELCTRLSESDTCRPFLDELYQAYFAKTTWLYVSYINHIN